ncbi:NAD-dependent epimerase/dehydratase family protein [Agromyces sp. CFH 90414]|uniref:NAD-dependent epimerase/dehydratase family protein n=1 Tax=Agromyces agglutinans TaxID=2662258 RepID=A0A6I2F6V7_9MICO|nr:NAD-dependent epimerase/dehydratase family protein [Agromyces agglutinans]MRG59984.1 NAD-dependent epimerase/dehydratase family protein [Agromyces agglutinans]
MRIVIIGATGNIGTAILRRLHQAGPPQTHELVGIARRLPDEASAPYAHVDWHRLDVSTPDATDRLAKILTGADTVIHLAWLIQPNHEECTMWATNVRGQRHLLDAVASAGVPHVIVSSSVGAYSPGPKHRRVDESWPTGGVHTSHYARHKAVNERMLDEFEAEHPGIVVSRVRPGLVFQHDAAREIAGLFIGRNLPTRWLGRVRLPVLPVPVQVVSQAVHADDLADAFARIVELRAPGAFNVAGEPVLGPSELGAVLGARTVIPMRRAVLRAIMWATWKLRLQASDTGWLDIATTVPVMSTERARSVLGWEPRRSSTSALRELLDGMAEDAHVEGSPPLSR